MGLSAAIHTFLLVGLGLWAVQPADFAMESGIGGLSGSRNAEQLEVVVEIETEIETIPSQVAPSTEVNIPEPVEIKEATPALESTESIVQQPTELSPPAKPDQPQSRPQANPQQAAAGSGGVQYRAKPDYLKNPPPRYPSRAKRLKQQGLVSLNAWVSASGRVQRLTVRSSSGYTLLDEAALESVKRWKFKPARMNGTPVDSKVIVPVRFELK